MRTVAEFFQNRSEFLVQPHTWHSVRMCSEILPFQAVQLILQHAKFRCSRSFLDFSLPWALFSYWRNTEEVFH